ncbi:MAG: hypothetical protein BZY88_13070 [SAR202 cluster bacterium Io17-Chloro-G9]|nr:MAG: hypothetical protein BZY88_13070 [SAR202 cluster bacterium Io17-Chloro-G9]
MGLVKVTGEIGLREEGLREVEFLVDTDALYTFLPPDLAAVLGLTFPVVSNVVMADRRTVEVPVGVAFLRLAAREGGVIVASMDVPMPLLGVSALEILGLKVDPVAEILEHTRPFGPAALFGVRDAPHEIPLLARAPPDREQAEQGGFE